MNKKRILFFALIAMSFSIVFSSCTQDEDDNQTTSTLANIMMVNVSPGTNAVDFYINDVPQNTTGISYGGNTSYIQSATGKVNLKVNKAQSANNIFEIDENLDLNGAYTLLALDTANSTQPLIIADDLTDPVLGKAHLRFIHASHNTPSIDIVNLADSSVVFGNQSFKQYTAFSALDAGSYSLGYRVLGDSNIISLPSPVNLGNGQIYTIVASGYNSDDSTTTVSNLSIKMINN